LARPSWSYIYILTGLMALELVSDQRTAAGTALLYTSVPVSLGTDEYYKTGDVHWEAAAILIPYVFIASIFGAKLNKITHKKVTLFSIGVSTLMVSGYFFYKSYNTKW
jgi:uncharacterized membrane protein YfcA